METLWNNVLRVTGTINFPNDILDILIVALLIYGILRMARSRAAGQVITVVVVLLILSYLSDLLDFHALNYIIGSVFEVIVIALVVVFQPELRHMMEHTSGTSLRGFFNPGSLSGDSLQTVEQTVEACASMSLQKVGALIVFEREADLSEFFKTGTVVDASVSDELLKNIFFPKAALHDGAVVIRKDRIAAAGCVLPLTENPDLSRDLGTRHRAAIGVTEHSDAVVVVISEESGIISCAAGAVLQRNMTPERLRRFLTDELVREGQQPFPRRLLRRLHRQKTEESHEDKN